MKTFTVEEIKTYLSSQDSFGDAIYFCTEENITKANQKPDLQDWLKTNCNLEVGSVIEDAPSDYIGRSITEVAFADGRGHFRTKYPVVIRLSGKDDGLITLETILGY